MTKKGIKVDWSSGEREGNGRGKGIILGKVKVFSIIITIIPIIIEIIITIIPIIIAIL